MVKWYSAQEENSAVASSETLLMAFLYQAERRSGRIRPLGACTNILSVNEFPRVKRTIET
jgi:hypothetical protein